MTHHLLQHCLQIYLAKFIVNFLGCLSFQTVRLYRHNSIFNSCRVAFLKIISHLLFFFIIKPTRCTNFPKLLRHETLHVSGSSSAHHQEFIHFTLGTGMSHTGLKTAFEHMHMTYTSAESTVNKLLMMDRGTAQNM
jgi:hypothetical protein